MSKTQKVIEIMSDSDDEYWGAETPHDEMWWQVAADDANKSPVKEGAYSQPVTPSTSGLATTMDEKLHLSPESRTSSNNSPSTRSRRSTEETSSHDLFCMQNTPSLGDPTQISREAPPLQASNIGSISPIRPRTASAIYAKGSPRSDCLNKTYAHAMDREPSPTAGPSGLNMTTFSIHDPTECSSKSVVTRDHLKYDTDEYDTDEAIETDTESCEPSTRTNSLLFPSVSRTTSMSSYVNVSDSSGPSSRKSSINHRDLLTSFPTSTTPPSARRTTGIGSSAPSRRLIRSATLPTLTASQKTYPNTIDEESIFRTSPTNDPNSASILLASNTPPPKKITTMDSISFPSKLQPSPSASLLVLDQKITSSSVAREPSPAVPPPPVVPASSSDYSHFSATASIPSLNRQTQPQTVPGRSSTSTKLPPESVALNLDFLNVVAGGDLPFCIIAHNDDVQKLMDARHICWGAQWNIARGVLNGLWKWSDVTASKLDDLRGSNVKAAWKVSSIILSQEIPQVTPGELEMWRDLDREREATVENRGRGLGLMGDWLGASGWYGGKIQQIFRLLKSDSPEPPYKIVLEKLESTRSNRFSRFLGSPGIAQIRMDSTLIQKEREQIHKFLSQNFVVCGRVFRTFATKEDSAYMMQPNVDFGRTSDAFYGDQHRLSFAEFLMWHNPLDLNSKQPISKWSTRWVLGLSTSVPVLEFPEENILQLPDLPLHDDSQGKLATEQILTDGSGLINEAALTEIYRSGILPLAHRPPAVQGRIGGAKGMWMQHPDDTSLTPYIWVRPSQTKIKLPSPLCRAHRIFELLSPEHVTIPSHLSMQTINNLSHNGVPHTVFTALIKTELEALIKPLTDWQHPHSMVIVAKAVHQAGRIGGARLQRVAGSSIKALGLSRDFHRDGVEEDVTPDADDVTGLAERRVFTGRSEFNEAPLSLHESAYELILAGFHPLTFEFLYDKMKSIVTIAIDSFVKSFHIPVSESLEAFILPDPMGVLKPGEIYFCSSQNLLNPETGAIFNCVIGPAIVGRNPTRMKSDMRKVNAVNYPELHKWRDVIIFSTQGDRSLASLLAGGDYDGDTGMLFWSPLLIEAFENSPISEPPANLLTEIFHCEVETVTQFVHRVSQLPPSSSQEELQKVSSLSGLTDTKVGLLSIYQDNAVYKHGYGSEEAELMAHVFNTSLDSLKTGYRLNQRLFATYQSKYGLARPACMDQASLVNRGKQYFYTPAPDSCPIRRDGALGAFVLDQLVEAGKEMRNLHLQEFRGKHEDQRDFRKDSDLLRPFQEAETMAERMMEQGNYELNEELQLITTHVNKVYDAYKKSLIPRISSASPKKKRGSRNVEPPTTKSARQFVEGPPTFVTGNVRAIKASYAYASCPVTFAFAVAYHDLCMIKATASGDVPTTRLIAETMDIKSSFLRVLGRHGGG